MGAYTGKKATALPPGFCSFQWRTPAKERSCIPSQSRSNVRSKLFIGTMFRLRKRKRCDVRHACLEAAVTPELRQDIGGRRKVREKDGRSEEGGKEKDSRHKHRLFNNRQKEDESGFFLPRELQNQLFWPRSGRHFGLLQGYRGANQDLRVLQACACKTAVINMMTMR